MRIRIPSVSTSFTVFHKLLHLLRLASPACALMVSSCFVLGAEREEAPNVVMIVADDLGYRDLGSYGQELIETPNIDRLAAEGIRFTQFYAGSPVCAPSRSVLLTGQDGGHTKIRANFAREGGLRRPPGSTEEPSHGRIGLGPDDTTIGNVMQDAGYWTGYVGKWHLSGYDSQNLPIHRGFNEYRGSDLASTRSLEADWEFHGDEVVPVPEELRADYHDDIKLNAGLDFIRRNSERRFFLFLSMDAPHRPFEIPSEGIYADRAWSEMARNYAAMITRLDDHVGRVMETLAEEGLGENTVVIFVSDNGGEHREPGASSPDHASADWAEWTQLFRSNQPLKGGKADMYEGGIRVPAIVHWPGHVEGGGTNADPWHFKDFLPTLAGIGGTQAPATADGLDIMSVLSGDDDYPEDRYLYWEFDHESFAQALRWRDWKLIRWTTYRKRIYGQADMDDRRRSEVYPLLELYNLSDDIREEHNVVEENPDIVETMVELLDSARTESPHWPLTEEERDGLRRSAAPRAPTS